MIPPRMPPAICAAMYPGTSLVEQILASHPQVFGAGELSALTDAIGAHTAREWTSGRSYPECLDGLTVAVADRMAGDYLAAVESLTPGDATCVTDKMHQNFAHVGMINLLFPDARVIHIRGPQSPDESGPGWRVPQRAGRGGSTRPRSI